ncbi:hemerythrin domain-containing protein [Streptomyces sp. NPDC047841]|uniref:hemerythrin domain-containing protein n=1 Tax=Streptomyces sp. NPDC047841 TaxID=3154708 RepID=UPI00345658BE
MSKTIKEQTVEQLGGSRSILVRQRREHQQIDQLMDQYLTLDDLHQRERVLKQLVQLVFSHAFAEETVLWPVVRASVPDGDELTARVEDEHQQINDLVADIERLPVGAPDREEKAQRAFALIRQDIRDEEDLLLPRLQDAVNTARLRTLGTTWAAVRETAPTHPHPVIPRRPPGNALLGVPLSVYDRVRDALSIGSASRRRR